MELHVQPKKKKKRGDVNKYNEEINPLNFKAMAEPMQEYLTSWGGDGGNCPPQTRLVQNECDGEFEWTYQL